MAAAKELLSACEIARVIGCGPQMVRERMKRGIWKIGRVVTAKQSGNRMNSYEVTKNELAEFLHITLEEVESRLNKPV